MAFLGSGGVPLAKTLTWTLGLRVIMLAGSHLVVYELVPLTPGRRGAVGDGVSDVLQYTALLTLYSSIMNLHPPNFRLVRKHYFQ